MVRIPRGSEGGPARTELYPMLAHEHPWNIERRILLLGLGVVKLILGGIV